MLLLACCLLSVYTVSFALEESTDIDLLPYIEDYPSGKLDWDAGLIYDVGRGYLLFSRKLSRSRRQFIMLLYFKCKLQANLEEIKISKYFVQL